MSFFDAFAAIYTKSNDVSEINTANISYSMLKVNRNLNRRPVLAFGNPLYHRSIIILPEPFWKIKPIKFCLYLITIQLIIIRRNVKRQKWSKENVWKSMLEKGRSQTMDEGRNEIHFFENNTMKIISKPQNWSTEIRSALEISSTRV